MKGVLKCHLTHHKTVSLEAVFPVLAQLLLQKFTCEMGGRWAKSPVNPSQKTGDDRIKASAIPLHSTYATVYSNQISPVELGELSLRVPEMEKDMEVRQGREASTLVF